MATLRLPSDSFGPNGSRGDDVPNPIVENIPRQVQSMPPDDESIIQDAILRNAAENVEDLPLEATQPRSQPPDPQGAANHQQHLVGILYAIKPGGSRLELEKSKKLWRIGRHPKNDFVLSGDKLSDFHCEISWNEGKGKNSVVTIVNKSRNGTWVGKFCLDVDKDKSAYLPSGTVISVGVNPDGWDFIFCDIERESASQEMQIWKEYTITRELGAGSFARVHRCIKIAERGNSEYAVKIINRNKLRGTAQSDETITREVNILSRLRHKNIVLLHKIFKEVDSIYLILDLVAGGNLFKYLHTHGALSEIEVRRMAGQICNAVAYIHNQGVVHRDLKPENVLLTNLGPAPDCRIADFGLAKLLDHRLVTSCGTLDYLAPEVLLREDLISDTYDHKVDSWSLGVIFYKMLTNRLPFKKYDGDEYLEGKQDFFRALKIDWSVLKDVLSPTGVDFLRHLLVKDADNREFVADMLSHPWIEPYVVPADLEPQHPLPADTAEFHLTPSPPASRQTTPTAHAGSSKGVSHLDPGEDSERLNVSDVAIPGLNLLSEGDVSRRTPGASRQGSAGAAVGQAGKRKTAELDEDDLEEGPVPKKKSKPLSKPKT